jgi:hypothetical protein
MRKTISVAVLMLAVAVPSFAQRVYVDYDRGVDRGAYLSFDWVPTPETSLEEFDPVLHSQVKNAIELHLSEGGLIEDEMMPDLLITYHVGVAGIVRLDAASYGFDYGPEWTWDPAWGTDAGDFSKKVKTYPKGTLIIDIWDRKAERVVWRGTMIGIVAEDPSAAADKIKDALRMMVEKWQEMSQGEP